ncbi:aminotransferase class I/II-fold pyridoxal phosphate-dependent enzyme [Devosia albogilva]|uniref:Aminotransferase class I/II-fold pyridoxal phosphate-dependent enzyme n=1 Tax=Devosia albogilva TaxID=429726 RepID=A0ABW5QGY4_9HYPH
MTSTPPTAPEAALTGSLRDFRAPVGPDLIGRASEFYAWQNLRREHELWPYARSTATAPQARCEARSDTGSVFSGINFASQDYLSLSSHPAIKAAAIEAIGEYGVHSAGSAALLGNTANSVRLEAELSAFLGGREIVLYPTGWAAGYGSIQGFVRAKDHVVMDILAHSCLQEGAKAATQNIHYHGHLNLEALTRKLQRIRAEDSENGIMVVTESLFSMHSDTPDLGALRALCDEYGATLLVDCAHDLGSIGEDGLGHLGLQNMLEGADIIIGSFSKTFASNGGFIAVRDRATAEYLRYYSATHTFSNALSPVQAATVLKALEIVRSEEGRQLRRQLMDNILLLRSTMVAAGLEVLGDPSPIVPVSLGLEGVGRFASRNLMALGGIANLVEYPAVPQGAARFRFQVMASHTADDIHQVVEILARAMRDADLEYRLANEARTQAAKATAAA